MPKPYIIGIAGGSGSGKTTFAERIKEIYADKVTHVSCDNYYLPHDDIAMEERDLLNYDSPDAFEFSLMARQISMLRAGKDVVVPIYDFMTHTRSASTMIVCARPIIIIDGILLFYHEYIRELIDLKIYVETDADERILRRARRDIKLRGRNLDGIVEQYLSTVKPMHTAYVEPTKAYADIIINGGLGDVALDLVCTKISKLL